MHDQILDLLRGGETAAALQQARVAVSATPEDAQAQRMLALALQQAGDDVAARAASLRWRSASSRSPRPSASWAWIR